MRVRPNPFSFQTAISFALILALAGTTAGCAAFDDWMSFDSRSEKAIAAKAQADKASLWEMTLMAGRYGVMLDQAREILNLPEPKEAPMFPSDASDEQAQRKALASYQVSVAGQFFADAARACKKRGVPSNVRAIACKNPRQAPPGLRAPPPLELPALSSRNDQVGNVITPWWDAVCAHAPKAKEGDAPACAME